MWKRDCILGCILGGAIGDAAGSAFEGSCAGSPGNLDWLDQAWQITDDTQLTLATCEALTIGKLEPALIAENLLRWFRSKRISRVGASTLKALRDLDAGCHWALAGRSGDRAAGNGAAMRIAPLAFCTEPDTPKGRQLIREVCRITHHNEEAYVGAVATVLAIRKSMTGSELPLLHEIASNLPDSVVRDRLLWLAGSETTICIAEAARMNGHPDMSQIQSRWLSLQVKKSLESDFQKCLAKLLKLAETRTQSHLLPVRSPVQLSDYRVSLAIYWNVCQTDR